MHSTPDQGIVVAVPRVQRGSRNCYQSAVADDPATGVLQGWRCHRIEIGSAQLGCRTVHRRCHVHAGERDVATAAVEKAHVAGVATGGDPDHGQAGDVRCPQQGDEASETNRRFLESWLAGKEALFPGYPFTIEPRNANPGSGTAKNWFFECFAIPAYTYEVGDDVSAAATGAAATTLAGDLVRSLAVLPSRMVGQAESSGKSCLGDRGPPPSSE